LRALERLTALPGRAPRSPGMEGLRAYAAAVVFQVHFFGTWARVALGVNLDQAGSSAEQPVLAMLTWLHRSHYGVDLFFFLSGYLVLGMVDRPQFHYGRFLRDRLLRLYPAFLVTTVGIAVAFYGWPHLTSPNLLANLALLNAVPSLGIKPINLPTWSLFFELVFYAGFPIVRFARPAGGRIGAWRVVGLAALVLAATAFSPGYAWRAIAFFAGAWLACHDPARLRRVAARLPDAAALGVFLAATTSFAAYPGWEHFVWIFPIPCTALVLKVLHGDGFLARGFRAPVLRAFGNVSYSFYLVHAFCVSVVFHFAQPMLPESGPAMVIACAVCGIVSFGLATAAAVVLFWTLERPYFVWKARRVADDAVGSGAPTRGGVLA
jgi:exopolysaccharide production protein ExoZ